MLPIQQQSLPVSTYFIADVHLSEQQPQLYALLCQFLNALEEGDQLYILGDLFALWIGDDDLSPFHQAVIAQLAALRGRGIAAALLLGNRDFLIKAAFAAAAQVVLLPEKHVIQVGEERLLLLHGDTLCSLDTCYQAFRRRTQQAWLQRLFLSLPLGWRRAIAARLRRQSSARFSDLSAAVLDVVKHDVLQDCADFHVSTMIHGHTHRPGIHIYQLDQQPIWRYTLSDWGEQGNYLRIDANGNKVLEYFGVGGQKTEDRTFELSPVSGVELNISFQRVIAP